MPRNTARWADRDGCRAKAARHAPAAPRTASQVYSGCGAGLHVEALALTGTGHGWPGCRATVAPAQPVHLRATTELLRFSCSRVRSWRGG